MESLVEQETELEARILNCKEQLVIVCEQLRNTEEDATELQQLERDLTELISLTEENLLEVKKQKLLLSLQTGDTLLQSAAAGGNHDAATTTTQDHDTGRDDGMTPDDHDDLVGMKCRAPLTESWGAVNHHNAVILSRDDDRSGLDFNVKVLFTNPRYKAMKPCPFFMEAKCKFTDDSCRFSHGHQVCFSDLKPFHDPDYSYIVPESRCIAKHSDDLWYDATVSSVGPSLSSISVYIHSLRQIYELKPEDVFPLPDLGESSDISDSELASKDDDDEIVRVLDWQPSGMTQALGEWERHTTGIGSKLLAKMGYIIGEGLGRQSQGRVEPVEIVILPPGKSLDACAALREGKKLKGDGKGKRNRGRLKKEKRARLAAAEAEEETDLFDFLNHKISNPGKTKSRIEPQHEESTKTGGTSRKQLNVQLLKVNEEMKAVGKRIKSLKESLTRNRGNKSMEAHMKEKMKETQDHLHQLQRQEARLSSSIKSQTDRKKLTEF